LEAGRAKAAKPSVLVVSVYFIDPPPRGCSRMLHTPARSQARSDTIMVGTAGREDNPAFELERETLTRSTSGLRVLGR
jgi:hypothetical protein